MGYVRKEGRVCKKEQREKIYEWRKSEKYVEEIELIRDECKMREMEVSECV